MFALIYHIWFDSPIGVIINLHTFVASKEQLHIHGLVQDCSIYRCVSNTDTAVLHYSMDIGIDITTRILSDLHYITMSYHPGQNGALVTPKGFKTLPKDHKTMKKCLQCHCLCWWPSDGNPWIQMPILGPVSVTGSWTVYVIFYIGVPGRLWCNRKITLVQVQWLFRE